MPKKITPDFDELCINTIRFLAVDAVEKAKSGHPGAPLGQAAMAYVLWDKFLKHNPADSGWADRDRFILSAGHASSLLYSLLYLTGYGLSLQELMEFRQWGSRTPGHPEYGLTPGVEATTGPLGQGFANGVGMAMAERWLAQRYNRPGYEIINHNTYAIVSDGDLQEGIASEAASLAGTLRLGKLIYLYDDNDISIEGTTDITFAEDVGRRFQAYGWRVIGPIDGINILAVDQALRTAQADASQPNLIICRTVIGYGSPNKAGTASAHGEPLGPEETRLTKEHLGWYYRDPFMVPAEVLKHFRLALERGNVHQKKWQNLLKSYSREYPEQAEQLAADISGKIPDGWDAGLADLFQSSDKPMATREASGRVMNVIAGEVSAFAGGSADLAPSIKTNLKGLGEYGCQDYCGRNMHFGVREHAMGAICNGMSLHKGIIPYGATFLIFSDYMRASIRLAALMKIRVVYIFSHDSVALGEDGPTHQPVEQLMSLRLIPDLVTIRPADATETAEAWKIALERSQGPTALVLSRQNLPVLDRAALAPASGVKQGGYILWEAGKSPQVILIGTGSETHIALEAGKMLEQKGVKARVVSLPSWELFEAQSADYRHSILPPDIRARVSIEAGVRLGWEKYVGHEGIAIGLSHFGASAPGDVIYKQWGLTAQNVADTALRLL
jgi:transketolase